MTLRPGWPAVSGAASQFDIRAGLRATVAQDAAGNVKTGVAVNAQTQSALVSARTDMKVDVAAFDAVLDRYGPVFVRHEGVDQVTLTAAPTANQRIDSIWVRQQETASPVSDAANGPLFGVAKGTASTSPVAPAIPAGAMRLADVQIPSTATATNSAGVTITQRYDFTAAQGAPLTFRTKTDLQAWAGWDGQKARVIADPTTASNGDYVSSGGQWFITFGAVTSATTTGAGAIYVATGFRPRMALVSPGPTNGMDDLQARYWTPTIWELSASGFQVRFRREDTNSWIGNENVRFLWKAWP